MKVLIVEVVNWEKFNPRSDVKSASWFRMSNNFFGDPDFYGQPLVVRLTWLFILCTASEKLSSTVKVNTKQIADALSTDDLKFTSSVIDGAIISLSKIRNSENGPILLILENTNKINTIESDRKHESNCPLQTVQTDITNSTDSTFDQAEKVLPMVKQKTNSQEILDHWNSLVKGRGHEGTKIQLKKITEALEKLRKDFSLEQIKQGVSNYFIVLYGDEYFYSFQFSCWDFLARKNNVNFMPELFNPSSYLGYTDKRKPGSNQKQSHRTQSTVSDAEIEEARQLGII